VLPEKKPKKGAWSMGRLVKVGRKKDASEQKEKIRKE
jgi:hypothetical protein